MYISKVSRMMDDYITIRQKNPDLPSTYREETLWIRSTREWLNKWAPGDTMDKLTHEWERLRGEYSWAIHAHVHNWGKLKEELNRIESDNLPDNYQLYLCVRLLRFCLLDLGDRHDVMPTIAVFA